MEFLTSSPEQTEAVGEALAAHLHPGDVIAYYGGLGAGKTAFTRGLARGTRGLRAGDKPDLYHRQRISLRQDAAVSL